MPQYSVRVSDDLGDEIEAYASEYDGSRSDAIRELLRRGTEYDRIQQENDRLQRAQTQLIGQREEHNELVEYVQEERSLQERREERRERERERRNAPAWRRAKWWLFGRSSG